MYLTRSPTFIYHLEIHNRDINCPIVMWVQHNGMRFRFDNVEVDPVPKFMGTPALFLNQVHDEAHPDAD
jgi:hypothetical protein